jgi:hypothetical protein
MRVSRMTVHLRAADAESSINEWLPDGFCVRRLQLDDGNVCATLVTPYGAVDVQARCAWDGRELTIDVSAAKWRMQVPAWIVGQVTERLVRGIDGMDAKGARIRLNPRALLGRSVTLEGLAVAFSGESILIEGTGLQAPVADAIFRAGS